jgi:hypothetical protein
MSNVITTTKANAYRTVHLEDDERFPLKRPYGRSMFSVDRIYESVQIGQDGVSYGVSVSGRALTPKGNLHATQHGNTSWHRPEIIPPEVAAHLVGKEALLNHVESNVLALVESARSKS